LIPPPFRLVSDETELRLVTLSWIVSQLDCKWKLECFFRSLTLRNARKLGKLAKFFLVVRESIKNLEKMTLKRSSEIQKFSQCRIFGGPRTETKFVKWSASWKRLRTAALDVRQECSNKMAVFTTERTSKTSRLSDRL